MKTFKSLLESNFYQYHDKLNPALWEKMRLKNEVARKLRLIAKKFVAHTMIPPEAVMDTIITGSNASYNWTKHSDIDLHIIYDDVFLRTYFSNDEIFDSYMQAKRKLFNIMYDINIRGFNVELYPQKAREIHHSRGVFSLKSLKWLKKPEYSPPFVDDASLEVKVRELTKEIDNENLCHDGDRSRELFDKILKMRRAGLSKGGEYSVENLTFKALRRSGHIEKLVNCVNTATNREFSIPPEIS